MLVLSTGRGTHGFTYDSLLGEWVLTHGCEAHSATRSV